MKPRFLFPLLAVLVGACLLSAQSPTGPIAPKPGAPIQQAPPQSKIVAGVTLVHTPVTVKDGRVWYERPPE